MDKRFRMVRDPFSDIRSLYDAFDTEICGLDCGMMCMANNPAGKPFCCDICHAVPAVYNEEWAYLQPNTNLWHIWREDECGNGKAGEFDRLMAETPENMLLLACRGPQVCQRSFRSLSCRQFPFFPYVSSDYRFLGLAYDREFAGKCWVIDHLEAVTPLYRQQFVALHDRIFAFSQDIFESYYDLSEQMRSYYSSNKRRFRILHRNGKDYMVSPGSERLSKISMI